MVSSAAFSVASGVYGWGCRTKKLVRCPFFYVKAVYNLKKNKSQASKKRKRSNLCTYKYSEKFDITIIIQLHKLYDFNELYNSYNYHKFFRRL